ncbi:hypothetical protein [Bradyrhizobium cosmicum]|uniref:Uncharacterized protein n=1 Tax=Bradyrhizobium cosmicum TaxID=1404864 RepID=A0AAI8QEW0_9BRAD|nr:hypothetical protein [Bradyrhizobium cosmicum]BAL78926.1 hypothetical protein S23_57350 [Bradyrhizobium cosmicum]
MQLHEFIKADELEALPDDDAHEAFAQFVRIAQTRLSERIEALSKHDDQQSWQQINDARHGFMNIVVAAAKKFEIEPISSLMMPRNQEYDDQTFRQFQSDLDFFVTQLVLENSARAKRDSVSVSSDLKAKIRTYLHHLRDAIEKSDLDEDKRGKLLDQLDAFEAELEKRRLPLMTVTLMVIALASAPGGLWSTGEAAQRLVASIFKVVGEAKNADDEARKRLIPVEPPKAIAPPRAPEGERKPIPRRRASNDLDDDIPF